MRNLFRWFGKESMWVCSQWIGSSLPRIRTEWGNNGRYGGQLRRNNGGGMTKLLQLFKQNTDNNYVMNLLMYTSTCTSFEQHV